MILLTNAHSAPLGTIQAYVDDLESRLSAARAGFLDNLDNAELLNIGDLSTLTAAQIAKLDNLDKAISALHDLAVGDLENLSQAEILSDVTPFDGADVDKKLSTFNDLAQSDILDDATPFSGANINDNLDKAISSLNDLAVGDLNNLSAEDVNIGCVVALNTLVLFEWDAVRHIDLIKAIQGTWAAETVDFKGWMGLSLLSSSNNIDDACCIGSFYVPVAGDYTVYLLAAHTVNHGIMHFMINNVDKGSIDLYNDGTIQNQLESVVLPSLTVGLKLLVLKMASKNGSSSGYQAAIHSLKIGKT